MKKCVLCAVLMLLTCFCSVYAKKQVVYVEYFSYASSIGEARAEQFRGSVLSNLNAYSHLQVVDVASQSSLSHEKNRRSDEDALSDETARIGIMKKLGADYIIQGYISEFSTTEQVNKKGKVSYRTAISCSFKVVECENGTLLSTDVFAYEGYNASTEMKSVQNVMNKVSPKIKEIVTKDFKLQSIMLDQDYVSNKGKMETCYINIGENDGVVPNTVFSVKRPILKVGRISWVEIGEIVVTSVEAADLSLCKIIKGAEDIQIAMDEVVSVKESDPNNAHDLLVESKKFK